MLFWALYAAASLFFYCVTLQGWRIAPNGIWGLYSLSDGAWAAWHSTSILKWGRPFELGSYSFLQGLGSLYPPNTPWLNPGALALSLPGTLETRYYLSYSVYFLELLAATVLFGRVLGLSLVRSTIVAQLLCLAIFPPYSAYFLTLPYLSLGPFYAHMISIFMVLLALFQRLGRAGARQNVLVVAGIALSLTAAVYSSAVQLTTFLPVYGLFGVALLAHDPRTSSLRWKMLTLAALAVLAYALGFQEYYVSTAKVSSSDLLAPAFPADLTVTEALIKFAGQWTDYNWCGLPQAWLCSPYPIAYLHAAGLLGAATSALVGRGLERRLGIAMLALVALIHVWPVAAQAGLLGKLARISPLYFLFAAYPFYAFFTVSLFVHLWNGIGQTVRWIGENSGIVGADGTAHATRPSALRPIALLAVPAAAFWIANEVKPRTDVPLWSVPQSGIERPLGNGLIELLQKETAIEPGAEFKGFVTTYFGSPEGPMREKLGYPRGASFVPEIYVDSRFYLQAVYGNSFMTTDLWNLNIPTLNEYGQWITKPLYVFGKQVFASAPDQVALHEVNLYRLNLKLLQALGVRFIVSDADIRDPRLRLRHQLQPSAQPVRPGISGYARGNTKILGEPLLPLNLYELTDSNVASYSPTIVRHAATVSGILRVMQDAQFDPKEQVVLESPLETAAFVSATQARMTVQRGGVHVSARSEGRSLLLIPVQFSHCLSLRSMARNASAFPRALRANLVQTVIVFERELEADLVFVFGPGRDVRCRLVDAADYERMDFSGWNDFSMPWLRY